MKQSNFDKPESFKGATMLPGDVGQEELIPALTALRGRRIAVLLNRGNRGDGLIHLGGRRLLRSLGLRWQEIREEEAPEEIAAEALLVFGCGAFCRGTHTLVPVVERLARQVREVVILPSSFDLECPKVRDFVRSWTPRHLVFCRERRSFDDLARANSAARRMVLAHDLAFWADVTEWAARPHAGAAGIFRGDREAVFDARPRGLPGHDVSRGPDTEPEKLLNFVARFSVVHTDRTHAAIAAAMMGRDVFFYRNAYFKNEAIYAHSLSARPNVRFVGAQPFSWRQCARVLFSRHVRRNAWHVRRRWQSLTRAALARS